MNRVQSSLPLVRQLGEELSGRGVRWCYWRSNGALERSAAGSQDLDLLVWRLDAQRFIEILRRLGFKEARPVDARQLPGVVHCYGYDGQTDRIVRVHARFQPGFEDDATKNQRMPIEQAFVREHVQSPVSRETSPEVEGLWWRVARGVPRHLGGRGRMGLVAGGVLIALVGADGAGKSSAVDALYRWLSPHLRVAKIHMGKPRWSWSTFPVKAVLTLIRRLSGILGRWRSSASSASREKRVRFRELIWHTITARDRYRAYRRARRLASQGVLVLCDRFPLPEIESMDGRRASRLSPARRPWPARLLIDLEESYYAAIAPPELLIVMRVHPDVALRRRPEDPEGRVRERALEILEIDGTAMGAHLVDADRPMREVHRELKSWIWARL